MEKKNPAVFIDLKGREKDKEANLTFVKKIRRKEENVTFNG